MRPWKPICLMILAMAITATASGQNWGGEPPGNDKAGNPEAGANKATKAPATTPAGLSLKAASSSVMKRRPFFNIAKRRRLGITIWSITPEIVAMHKAGELAGLSQDEVAMEVAGRLAVKRRGVYATEKTAWEAGQPPPGDDEEQETFMGRIIALIIRLLPLILMFF